MPLGNLKKPLWRRLGIFALPLAMFALASCREEAHPRGASDTSATAMLAESQGLQRSVFFADLDCEGGVDSVFITRTQIRVAGSIVALRVDNGENLPEVLDTADFNGDGVLDLLIVDVDQSSVWTGVLLVRRGNLTFAGLDARIPSTMTSYLWETTEGHGECGRLFFRGSLEQPNGRR